MGVTVQLMVDAEVSGVLFTCNPVTGDPSMVALNASWGLGIAVVSGEVTPDDYLVSKITREVVRRTVSSKHVEYVPDAGGRGTVRLEVPAERRDEPCLGEAAARGARRDGEARREPLREPSGRRVGARARCGSAGGAARAPGSSGDDAPGLEAEALGFRAVARDGHVRRGRGSEEAILISSCR